MKDVYLMYCTEMARAIHLGLKTQTRRVVDPQPIRSGVIVGPYFYKPLATDRHGEYVPGKPIFGIHDGDEWGVKCPYGVPGDLMVVKETWDPDPPDDDSWDYNMYSDGVIHNLACIPDRFKNSEYVLYRASWNGPSLKWHSSMMMPRWAARSMREITGIRAERVQEISYKDARAEGMPCEYSGEYSFPANQVGAYQANYRRLWDILNAKPKPVKIKEDGKWQVSYYVSYPWEEIDETREYRGLPWYVTGNPLVWVVEFKKENWNGC